MSGNSISSSYTSFVIRCTSVSPVDSTVNSKNQFESMCHSLRDSVISRRNGRDGRVQNINPGIDATEAKGITPSRQCNPERKFNWPSIRSVFGFSPSFLDQKKGRHKTQPAQQRQQTATLSGAPSAVGELRPALSDRLRETLCKVHKRKSP